MYVCHRAFILALIVTKAFFPFIYFERETNRTDIRSICLLEDYIGAQTAAHTYKCIGCFQMINTLYYLDNGVNYFTNAQILHVIETICNRIFGQLNG